MIVEKVQTGVKDIIFVYTICSNIAEAREMGISAIKERLAISMDYWNVNSVYPWRNIIKEIDQYMIMFSTQRYLSDKLIKHIESIHSYNIPMVAKCEVATTNIPYSQWVKKFFESEEKIYEITDLDNRSDPSSLHDLK